MRRRLQQATAEAAGASSSLQAAQADVAAQATAAAERQKRFNLLHGTFKRREEGLHAELAQAAAAAEQLREDLQAAQEACAAARQVDPLGGLRLEDSMWCCVRQKLHVLLLLGGTCDTKSSELEQQPLPLSLLQLMPDYGKLELVPLSRTEPHNFC